MNTAKLAETNVEAEYISCLMHNNELIGQANVLPEQLTGQTRKIYEAIKKLHDEARPIKVLTVSTESGVDIEYIKNIYKTESVKTLFREYESVIKNKYIAKKSKELAAELSGVQSLADYEDIIKRAETYAESENIEIADAKSMMREYEESIKNRINTGIRNPFVNMSAYISKFYAGQYVVIGGRPSKGKSAFMLSLLRRLSCHVGIVSLETTVAEIAARLIAQQSHIALDIVANSETQFIDQRVKAMAELYEKGIYVYDKSSTWRKIRSAMRKMVNKFNCKVIGIDYVQLVNMGKGKDRTEALGEMSRECKEFARRNECTVIALAQLGRGADEGRPKLKDLQWSSQLEQDADVVILIHEDDGKFSLQIEKNRDGRTGVVDMTFNKFCVDWEDNGVYR